MLSTVFSQDRRYRYTLWRQWDMFTPTFLQVIGLNPSTADETKDDPTIRRCIDYAKRWGYGGLCMTNLFAYRSTDPSVLADTPFYIGGDNDQWLCNVGHQATLVLAAWGAHAVVGTRGLAVQAFLETCPLVCLGRTQSGAPRHPLYVKKTQEPLPYLW